MEPEIATPENMKGPGDVRVSLGKSILLDAMTEDEYTRWTAGHAVISRIEAQVVVRLMQAPQERKHRRKDAGVPRAVKDASDDAQQRESHRPTDGQP